MPFNKYQQMHHEALFGRKDHDHQPKTAKKYALFEGKNEVERGAWSLCTTCLQEKRVSQTRPQIFKHQTS